MVTHGEFVNQIREVVDSLGLIVLRMKSRMKSHLAVGFWPDLQVVCGVCLGDRVFVEAINGRASLKRDIGSLLALKANYDADGTPYRRMFAVCSDGVKDGDLSQVLALEKSDPKFQILRLDGLKYELRQVLKGALRERLERLNNEELEWYFDRACPQCGEYFELRRIAEDKMEWECMKCGFKWTNPKGC